jgi:DNA-3-methyladenine glycosylase II
LKVVDKAMYLTTFYPTPPYNFDVMLDILSRYAYPTLDIAREGAYWRALRSGEEVVLFRVTASGSVETPALEVHLEASSGAVDDTDALNTLRHILQVDAERAAFYNVVREDAALWSMIEPLLGVPQLRSASLFEALVQTIIEQQIAWTAAQRAQRWLVEWAGNRITYDGVDYFAFPTAAQIAQASVDDLIPLKITFKRMALLIDVAQRVTRGQLDLEGLQDQPATEAYAELLKIKGVGHWTAVVALERAYGHSVHVAYNDVALQAAVNHFFFNRTGRASPEVVIDTFERYGPFAGTAAHYTLLCWVLTHYKRRET